MQIITVDTFSKTENANEAISFTEFGILIYKYGTWHEYRMQKIGKLSGLT